MSLFPHISLFLGGARSGKSALAEQHCLSSKLNPIYFATARSEDQEMELRIESHRLRRGSKWQLKELPLDLSDALNRLSAHDVVLIDCLTLWLSNIMFANVDILTAQKRLLDAMLNCPAKIVCVSNELGMGLVPDSRLGRDFRDAQGELNQAIASISDLVIFTAAGLALPLKGKPPEAKNDP